MTESVLFCPFRDTTTLCLPTGRAGAVHVNNDELITFGWLHCSRPISTIGIGAVAELRRPRLVPTIVTGQLVFA